MSESNEEVALPPTSTTVTICVVLVSVVLPLSLIIGVIVLVVVFCGGKGGGEGPGTAWLSIPHCNAPRWEMLGASQQSCLVSCADIMPDIGDPKFGPDDAQLREGYWAKVTKEEDRATVSPEDLKRCDDREALEQERWGPLTEGVILTKSKCVKQTCPFPEKAKSAKYNSVNTAGNVFCADSEEDLTFDNADKAGQERRAVAAGEGTANLAAHWYNFFWRPCYLLQ